MKQKMETMQVLNDRADEEDFKQHIPAYEVDGSDLVECDDLAQDDSKAAD